MKHNIKYLIHIDIYIGKNVYIVHDAQPFYDIWQFLYFKWYRKEKFCYLTFIVKNFYIWKTAE